MLCLKLACEIIYSFWLQLEVLFLVSESTNSSSRRSELKTQFFRFLRETEWIPITMQENRHFCFTKICPIEYLAINKLDTIADSTRYWKTTQPVFTCSKSTIETPEICEVCSNLTTMSTLNRFSILFACFYCWLWTSKFWLDATISF